MNQSTKTPIKVYYFRILSDQDDEFFRDIEILSDQTFREFHDIIQRSIEFEGNELASFFTCDLEWDKQIEITLIDMEEEELPIVEMKDARIQDFAVDKNQRLLYEYDFLNPVVLFIELMQTKKPQSGRKYPFCVNCHGNLGASMSIDDPLEIPIMNKLDVSIDDDDLSNDDEITEDSDS